jgi:integrase
MARPSKGYARYSTQHYKPKNRKFDPKKDKRWAVVYPHPMRAGKLKTETFKSETEAIDRVDTLNRLHRQSTELLETEHWTVKHVLDFWKEKKASKQVDSGTVEQQADYIASLLGGVPMNQLRDSHYEQLDSYLRSDKTRKVRSEGGYSRYFKTFRAALYFAKKKNKIQGFPALSDFIDEDYEPRDRVATREEIERLRAACYVIENENGRSHKDRKHLDGIITWLLETACRSGELKTIRVADINVDDGFVWIRQSKRSRAVKPRKCGISPRLKQYILDTNLLEYPDDTLVIGTPLRMPNKPYDFKRSWAKACEIAKVDDLNIHDLRRTGITEMLEREISLPLVAQMVGHEPESIVTLKVYAKFTQGFIQREMLKMAA